MRKNKTLSATFVFSETGRSRIVTLYVCDGITILAPLTYEPEKPEGRLSLCIIEEELLLQEPVGPNGELLPIARYEYH